MGVIRCTGPDKKGFIIVIIPKCGSTTLRHVFSRWRNPDQYDVIDADTAEGQIKKLGRWSVQGPFKGTCTGREWAFVRNPWKRLVSRWNEKAERVARDERNPFSGYVRTMCSSGSENVMARTQASIVGKIRTLYDIDHIEPALLEINEAVGIDAKPTKKRARSHDWRVPYRENPETVDMVRRHFADDFDLGFDWESPL